MTQTQKVTSDVREADLGRILEESLNEIYIFDAESLRFLRVNRGALQNLGYSMEELSVLTPLDLKPEFSASSFANLIKPLHDGSRRKVQFETVHRRKNGTLYPVEIYLQLSTFEGFPAFLAMVVDTTERTRVEKALQESEELHRITLESISDAVFITDENGGLRYVCPNVDVIFGYSESEVAAMGDIALLLNGDVIDDAELEDCNEIANVQRAIFDKYGGRHDVLINVKRVAIRGGTRLYTCRDVTSLTQVQNRLVHAERLAAVGQMVTVVAHESRNAIQRIQANAEMLRCDLEGNEICLPGLAKIENACGEMGSLFEELRGYTSPIQLDRSPSRLGEMIDAAWENLQPVRDSRNAQLHIDSVLLDVVCHADRQRMVQVFRNLFENSLAACLDPVRIEIASADCEMYDLETLRVTVRDNGPGLSAEQRMKIFDPFYTTKSQGTGLGMAIARRIIEAHNGTIDLVEGDHTGAQFLIELPLERAAAC